MQSSEPSIVERMAATFYNLMRQIYVEQIWRQNEQQPTKTTELGHIRSAFSRISEALSSKYCLALLLLTHTITPFV